MKTKIHGWSTRVQWDDERIIITVAAGSLTEACEKLRLICDDIDIDPVHVGETTIIDRRAEPRAMEGYQSVAMDWRKE